RAEAEELAAELAAFPQTCMLADRASVYAQWELSFDVALANEFQGGLAVIESGETLEGAQRFKDGEGRHGRFE
ncbi:enoyl-CoA hydratase, partial [Pseudomonas aeruginosa]|nr:enoyl-CoA hydratase [Pseudomonas aeruginosa]